MRRLFCKIVLRRLVDESLSHVTVAVNGSVFPTSRHAEGTAISYTSEGQKGPRVTSNSRSPKRTGK